MKKKNFLFMIYFVKLISFFEIFNQNRASILFGQTLVFYCLGCYAGLPMSRVFVVYKRYSIMQIRVFLSTFLKPRGIIISIHGCRALRIVKNAVFFFFLFCFVFVLFFYFLFILCLYDYHEYQIVLKECFKRSR